MLFNEMLPAMPMSGFGSPLSSPPEREVPSPSQYTDPSSSPPSMHSPPHTGYTCSSEGDKLEAFLKEEPLSPYNSTGCTLTNSSTGGNNAFAAGLLMTPPHPGITNVANTNNTFQQQMITNLNNNTATIAAEQQQHFQMQMHQQQQPNQQSHFHQLQLNQQQQPQQLLLQQQPQQHFSALQNPVQSNTATNNGFQPQLQRQSSTEVFDYELQQILNHPEIAKTVDCLMTQDPLLLHETPINYMQQQQGPGFFSQMPSSSPSNPMTKAGQQYLTPQAMNNSGVPSPSAASPQSQGYLTPSDSAVNSPQLQGYSPLTPPGSTDQQQFNEDDTFASLLEAGIGDIKTEVDALDYNKFDTVSVLDTLVRSTMDEAGVSHSPIEWSAADVRVWLKKTSEIYLSVPLGDLNTSLNIDGPALIRMNSAQFTALMGSKESDTLRDCLCQWLASKCDSNSNMGMNTNVAADHMMQVKHEVETEPELDHVKQEIVPQAMLPTPVVNHNNLGLLPSYKQAGQIDNQATRMNIQDQQKHYRNYQQQQIHQAQQPQESLAPRFAMNQPNSSVYNQQQFAQHTAPSGQLANNSLGNQGNLGVRSMNAVAHQQAVSSLAIPPSPLDSKASSIGLPSPNGNPIPLLDGAKGYMDDSEADLSALLQSSTNQHPTTLDQDEVMETDEEEEAPVIATPTPSSGRTHIQLWQFLKELLNNSKRYGTCIRWLDRKEAIFKIEDSVKVATLWGERKNRPQMNYDKLSRSIRQYYNKSIMKKTERSQRLVYQFCSPYGQ